MKLEKFIKKYNLNYVNPNIKFNGIEYTLLYIDSETNYEEALKILEQNKLRGATIDELLGWEDWDGEKQIIACGSLYEVDGKRHVLCLHSEAMIEPEKYIENRRLALLNIQNKWFRDIYLLGVREI